MSAFLSNLERADIHDPRILEQAIVFFGTDKCSERIKTENIVEVLIEMKENGYHGYSPKDYYNIYADSLTAEQVRASAEAQLEKCNLESGYYDNPDVRKEKEPKDNGALLKWEWFYTYMGDFCIEKKITYHYIYGNEISKESTVYYKGQECTVGDLKNAQEVYMQPETNSFITYTKSGKIETNFGVHVPQF